MDNHLKPEKNEDNTNETTALTATNNEDETNNSVINTSDGNNVGVDSLNGVVWKLYISRLLTAWGDR